MSPRDEALKRLTSVVKEVLTPRQILVQKLKEWERLLKIENKIVKGYIKEYKFFRAEGKCLRIFFRPLMVPGGLTKDDIFDCIELHDHICIHEENWSELRIIDQPLLKLRRDIELRRKTGMNNNLTRYLKKVFEEKTRVKELARKNDGSLEWIDSLLIDEQDEFFRHVKTVLKRLL